MNDAGFWMVREYFGLQLKQTVVVWSVSQTIVPVVGLTLTLAADRAHLTVGQTPAGLAGIDSRLSFPNGRRRLHCVASDLRSRTSLS